jgi:hypothetical protein
VIQSGDKITCAVYFDGGSTFVLRTRFRAQVATLHTSAEVTVGIESFVCDCLDNDEGVYWIRGWPTLDSEDVTTLLAAFALAGDRESSLLFRNDEDWDDFDLFDSMYWDDKLIPQGLVR